MKSRGLIRRFLPYYKKYTKTMVFDLLCAAFTTVCELVLPMIVRTVTNAAAYDPAALTVSFVLHVGIFYLVLRVIDAAAYYYMASVGHIMGSKMETDMRRDLFAHLQNLSFRYYDNTKIGTLMSRITSDLFDVTEFAHHCPEEFFIAFVKITVSFVLLCRVHIPLTCIVFVIVPIMLVVLMYFNRKMRAGFREQRHKIAILNAQVEDSLLGVRVVRSFTGEAIEEKKFAEGNEDFLKIKSRVYRFMGQFQSANRFFEGFMYIVVVVAGALFLIYGHIDAGDLVAYLLYVTTLLNSIRKIVDFAEQFQRGMTGVERFFEIMDEVPDIVDEKDARPLEKVTGDIEFKQVDFSYNDGEKSVLNHINLNIRAGERFALVGPSGGGKTTLCSLIPRFYDISAGSILIDGTDIREFTIASLRAKIGVVQQDVYLFSGSVRENIEYGRPGASDAEIEEAAKQAGAHDFIMSLPEGYDTYVGERGVKLSGGQKQRISIARVFLKNPPILILDEATSALDNESEQVVQQSLEKLAVGRTTIIVAHRLSTIRNADKIAFITANGVEEEGTHQELLAANGAYARLYQASLGENSIGDSIH
ncbi:MAG: ABC transporter ATP-binding protein [Clostridiales bacterium]|nr:ABC transporter ATP-binding protein [Clostridiales bacterium]